MSAAHTPAAALQAAREAADLANHRERLVWLSAERPRWSCGALVDCHTRNVLLQQSRAALAKAQGAAS
ncbi:hypothetical protein APR50_10610 [Variovorax paradoxus]|jgi:hypothetical protein|uniref:hypothetical protein n=1 Tax=Variovorax paradoxus TaxID=34073 RepID=UPI0006E68C7A|nr:hypothetical protein APR50_10610 [Variovorax paradoxus]KPV11410.1 hypothetical protein APR49_09485 [Variovorax paradoxus]